MGLVADNSFQTPTSQFPGTGNQTTALQFHNNCSGPKSYSYS